MSFDDPSRSGRTTDTPSSDPLAVFQSAIEQAMKGKVSTEPHLVTSGPWVKTEAHLGTFREVRVWRGDKGGPRIRVMTVADGAGDGWYATIPSPPDYQGPKPPVRRERVGADLTSFIDALIKECAPREAGHAQPRP